MKKLTVFAYRNDADAIVRRLMNLRCVDIRNTLPGDGLIPERPEDDGVRAEAQARLRSIREVMPYLAKYSTRKRGLRRVVLYADREEFVSSGRADKAWNAVVGAEELHQESERLTAEITRVRTRMQTLLPWLDYDAPLNAEGSASTLILLGAFSGGADHAAVEKELSDAGAYSEFVSGDGRDWYASVTMLREDETAINRILTKYGFTKTAFPDVASTAQAAYDACEAELSRLDKEVFAAQEKMRDYAEFLDEIEILSDIEETTVRVSEQKRKLLCTENCVVLEGWIPEKKTDSVTGTLSKFECACEIAEPEDGEEPPVLLHNNKFAESFEWVIGMYSYPKYGSYDPTLIMGIFYFLIFGLMFADVGYGLLLTVACFGGIKLLNPKDSMKRMMLMFGYCGISCMLMGVLFGGWFGNMPTAIMNSFIYHEEGYAETTALGRFFSEGIIMNPITSSTAFLVLAIGFGEIHLITGMAINMIETWKKGERLTAVCSTVPYWVFFAGVDLLAPDFVSGMIYPEGVSESAAATMAQLSDIGLYVLFAGMAMILFLKGLGQKSFTKWLTTGLGGLYSLISFASDLLSYSRILALGLVAGVIAQVINMLTGLGATGVIGFIMMVIVMIVGHVLNLAINLLGTFVHAARLQYIEFFGKFYEDGGKPFDPALPAENYSEDTHNVPN